MNKYAELNKIATLYRACRGILRVKLAAAAPSTTTTPPKPTTPPTPGSDGTSGTIAPTKTPPKQTWGEWFQDMVDWGNDQMQSNGALVTREQQAAADQYNAQQHQQAMAGLAKGEWNDWDPSQQASAMEMQTGTATEKENADSSGGNGGGNNITINNNMPENSGGGGGGYSYPSEGGGGGQQFQSSPSFADYIGQYSQYRNRTA